MLGMVTVVILFYLPVFCCCFFGFVLFFLVGVLVDKTHCSVHII